MLGTTTGQAHNQRQGTGLATVVDTTPIAQTAIELDQDTLENYRRTLRERDAEKNAAIKRLYEINPDYYAPHQDEMRSEMNDLLNFGASIMADGVVDPFIGSDEKSKEFRARKAKLEAMSRQSMLVKNSVATMQAALQDKNPDEYDPASLIAAKNYVSKPLSELLTQDGPPPMLKLRTPQISTVDHWNKLLTPILTARKDAPLEEGDVADIVSQSFDDPAQQRKLILGYAQMISDMLPEERARLEDAASATGRELWQQKAIEDVMDWQSVRTGGYSFADDFLKFADDLEAPTYSYQNERGGGSGVAAGKFKTLSETSFDAWIRKPSRLMAIKKEVPLQKGETELEYIKRITPIYAKKARDMSATKTVRTSTGAGEKEAELAMSRSKFLQDMYSKDKPTISQAANFLLGQKLYTNMGITGVSVKEDTPYRDGYRLDLKLETNTNSRAIADELAKITGEDVNYEVVESKGERLISIPLRSEAAFQNALLKLHDKAVSDSKGTYLSAKEVQDMTTPKAWGGSSSEKLQFRF